MQSLGSIKCVEMWPTMEATATFDLIYMKMLVYFRLAPLSWTLQWMVKWFCIKQNNCPTPSIPPESIIAYALGPTWNGRMRGNGLWGRRCWRLWHWDKNYKSIPPQQKQWDSWGKKFRFICISIPMVLSTCAWAFYRSATMPLCLKHHLSGDINCI